MGLGPSLRWDDEIFWMFPVIKLQHRRGSAAIFGLEAAPVLEFV